MAIPKYVLFTREQLELAHFASALCHPARIAIVTMLQEQERMSCGEIVRALPLSQATVSQHIKMLVDRDILLVYPEGPKMYYKLDCEKVKRFCHTFQCTLKTQKPEAEVSS